MARILTGIQSTGIPHLGNLLGAVLPGIQLSNSMGNESFFFIADLHTLTTVHDPALIRENTYATAAAWMSCGFDHEKHFFYRQSDLPEVTELTWYLTCFFPFTRLELATSYKDKVASGMLSQVSSGLFFYPMLMAADILMYDAQVVPVGKDQRQHLEFTRDVAERINSHFKKEIFVIPEASIQAEVQTVPGTTKNTDGSFMKMSKTYGNTINVFEADKPLRKTIMSIQTDSLGVDDPKDPDKCLVYALYKLVGSEMQAAEMHEAYLKGGMGYGAAKQLLFEAIVAKFGPAREKYHTLMNNKPQIDFHLEVGAAKARKVGQAVLQRVRENLGYKKFEV
jgi:tryptophanyl-tRNA synthetase